MPFKRKTLDHNFSIWLTYGVEVKISMKYTTTEQGCEDLIKEASKLGPIDAIFNLDGLFENQTKENLVASLARNTLYLDRVTKKLCPKLRLTFNLEVPIDSGDIF